MKLIKRVSIPLFVNDYDIAIEFYCNITNLFNIYADNQINESVRFLSLIYYNLDFPFSLDVELATNEKEETLIGNQGGSGAFLGLPVDDCKELYSKLSAKNVKFDEEPIELPVEIQATCYDPFGNKVCLIEML